MHPRRRSSAFTLAEVLLALLIVSLALLGLVSEQIYAVRAQGKVSLRHRVGVVAASQMAGLQQSLLVDFVPRRIDRQALPDGMEYAASVTPVPDLADLLDVALTVYYTDNQGPQHLDLHTRCLRP